MTPAPLIGGKKKSTATDAIVGLFTIVLVAAVVATLYFGREVLIPLALAALLTFMLSPLVMRLERGIGRVPAVFSVAVLVFCCLGSMGWVITRQAVDLATRLPDYRINIERKLQTLQLSTEGPIKRFSEMIVEVEAEIPGFSPARPAPVEDVKAAERTSGATAAAGAPSPKSAPVNPLDQVRTMLLPFFGLLATTGIVIVLAVFMLLRREDLRGRLIKIVGRGRISSTSRAMEDAATRVSHYLITLLVVNIAFGAAISLGLYFIGVPNAFLWGALAGVLRFIPYIGAWIAAVGPVVLALAVSPAWEMLFLTLGLFAVLELAIANFIEPLIYRSSTGVSSLALIVSAIFWTWLWGPIGLLLSTPLTVCVAVIGRHVPQLSFFGVLLGNEEPLTPSEECYHRLLVGALNETGEVVDSYVKANSLTALFDDVLIPTIALAELDLDREQLEESQRTRVLQGVKDILEDLKFSHAPELKGGAEQAMADGSLVGFTKSDCRVVCLPTRAERDEIAGLMLAHLLRQQGFDAVAMEVGAPVVKLAQSVDELKADVVCISVIPPSSVIHARHLCSKLRSRFPSLRIIVGVWGAIDTLQESTKGLRASGADEVVATLAEAVVQLAKYSSSIIEHMVPASVPDDEDVRLAALTELKAFSAKSDPAFDRTTKNLTRTFDVPIALLSFIDRERQHFKSQYGLPEELSTVCDIPREESVCGHVVADNAPLVVEDLSRDRRFANNPLLKKYHLRFYAGVPLRAANGQPVGALCIMDTKPRRFSETDQRLLRIMGEDISAGLSVVPSISLKPEPVA